MAASSPVKIVPGANGALVLTGSLSFATVTAALAEIKPQLTRGVRRLDLSRVEHADSAGLALLVECVKQTHHGQHSLAFEGVPAQLSALAAACGLSGLLTNAASRTAD